MGKGKRKRTEAPTFSLFPSSARLTSFQLLPFNESPLENFVWTDKPPYLSRPLPQMGLNERGGGVGLIEDLQYLSIINIVGSWGKLSRRY